MRDLEVIPRLTRVVVSLLVSSVAVFRVKTERSSWSVDMSTFGVSGGSESDALTRWHLDWTSVGWLDMSSFCSWFSVTPADGFGIVRAVRCVALSEFDFACCSLGFWFVFGSRESWCFLVAEDNGDVGFCTAVPVVCGIGAEILVCTWVFSGV